VLSPDGTLIAHVRVTTGSRPGHDHERGRHPRTRAHRRCKRPVSPRMSTRRRRLLSHHLAVAIADVRKGLASLSNQSLRIRAASTGSYGRGLDPQLLMPSPPAGHTWAGGGRSEWPRPEQT